MRECEVTPCQAVLCQLVRVYPQQVPPASFRLLSAPFQYSRAPLNQFTQLQQLEYQHLQSVCEWQKASREIIIYIHLTIQPSLSSVFTAWNQTVHCLLIRNSPSSPSVLTAACSSFNNSSTSRQLSPAQWIVSVLILTGQRRCMCHRISEKSQSSSLALVALKCYTVIHQASYFLENSSRPSPIGQITCWITLNCSWRSIDQITVITRMWR